MHPVAFKKAIVEAYLAGAEYVIQSELKEYPSKKEAREWFDDQYGRQDPVDCDCCEEQDDE